MPEWRIGLDVWNSTPSGTTTWAEDFLTALRSRGLVPLEPSVAGSRLTLGLDLSAASIEDAIATLLKLSDHTSRRLRLRRLTVADEIQMRYGASVPPLVGAREVAALLKVSRPRVTELLRTGSLPKPAEVLASGPVWSLAAIDDWKVRWPRRGGRPSVANPNPPTARRSKPGRGR
jgi:predicted DNA-binding transcriptional regulator AlpA